MEEVKLYGMWASPFSMRVEWALKLKGIPYKYAEEDLQSKSQDLLQYNPVYKKIPVLVHKGKPIVESLVILEYIEDTWKEAPLMPEDPYTRSRVRFWSQYFDQTLLQAGSPLIGSEGEEQEKAKEGLCDKLAILEEGLKNDFSSGTPYLHGERPGFLDIVVGTLVNHKASEEAIGMVFIDPQRFPVITKWLDALKKEPIVKETTPAHDKLVAYVRVMRERALKPQQV